MPAGLINIISYGADDLYLTGVPQITFFKIIYRRYTNFAKESVPIAINNLNFDNAVDVELPRVGDLLNELYLQFTVPSINILRADFDIPISTMPIDPSSANNYAIIVNFMKLNTSAYRICVNDSRALSLQTYIMANDIMSAFNSFSDAPVTISAYRNLLSPLFITTGIAYLNPDTSDISAIVSRILNDLNNDPKSWTNDKILSSIQIAINNSVQVQNYFFNTHLQYNAEYTKSISQYAYFAWVDKLGHSIIDYIDISIGGEKIDRHYGDWINVWHELTSSKSQQYVYDRMIGNISVLTSFDQNAKPSYTITLPLQFWFCRHSGTSLPIVALTYNPIILTVKLKRFEDCAYIEKPPNDTAVTLTDWWEDRGFSLNASILADYVYLDTLERKRFAQSAHEYLIERVQVMMFDNVNDSTMAIDLDFRSPCKELIWFAQKSAWANNTTNYYKSLWNNYSLNLSNSGIPVSSAYMDFNGHTRMTKENGQYYNYVQAYARHNNIPSDGINVYSFSLYPEEYQPSCTCNFSKIPISTLYLTFDPMAFYYDPADIDSSLTPVTAIVPSNFPAIWKYYTPPIDTTNLENTSLRVRVFAISYNILRIIGGMGSLAYQ